MKEKLLITLVIGVGIVLYVEMEKERVRQEERARIDSEIWVQRFLAQVNSKPPKVIYL